MWELFHRIPVSTSSIFPLSDENWKLKNLDSLCLTQNPDNRISLKDAYLELKTSSDGVCLPETEIEKIVSRLFTKQDFCSWNELVSALTKIGEREQALNSLKFLLDNGEDKVEKYNWYLLLKWFSPIIKSDDYQTTSNTISIVGYGIPLISDIVSPK